MPAFPSPLVSEQSFALLSAGEAETVFLADGSIKQPYFIVETTLNLLSATFTEQLTPASLIFLGRKSGQNSFGTIDRGHLKCPFLLRSCQ